jgi:hypothetical protein
MRGLWLLVHVLGFTLWLGGGIATMVAGVTAKRLGTSERLSAYKLIGAIQRILVAPGAIAVVLSGFFLAQPYMKQGVVPAWLGLMMGSGIVGAIGAVAISVPTAAKLARLEPDATGQLPAAFPTLRKRQIVAATLAGTFGLIAMFAATLGRG